MTGSEILLDRSSTVTYSLQFFLGKIMPDVLDDHKRTHRNGGREVIDLSFADINDQ